MAFQQEAVLLSSQLSGLPSHHSLLHYRSFSMKFFASLPSLPTISWIAAAAFALTTNVWNLQSKIDQSEPNWNDLLGRCWFSQVYSLPTVNASKKDILKGVKHFHKGVARHVVLKSMFHHKTGISEKKKKRTSRSAAHLCKYIFRL